MAFQKGNKLAKGGARPNSGPNPDWLKEKCQRIIEKRKLIEFLADVADGKYTERVFAPGAGEMFVQKSCDAETRMKAIGMLLERGYGKPAQALDVKGEGAGGNFVIIARHQ